MPAPAAPSRFDVETLRTLTGDRAFARGRDYHKAGQVTILSLEADRVLARVEGSETYRSVLTGKAKRIGGECTCPAFEDYGFCKHLVAVGLTANDAASAGVAPSASPMDRIRRHLRGLDTDTLVAMLTDLAERDDALFRRLDLASTAADADDEALLTRFREAINDATRTGGHVDYEEIDDWAAGVEAVLDAIAGLIPAGKAALALRLAEHACSRIGDALAETDEDGQGSSLLEQVARLHLDACRAAPPDPVDLARDLFEREMEDEWGQFAHAAETYADILGETGLAEYRRLATEAWNRLPVLSPGRKAAYDVDTGRSRLMGILDFFAARDGDVDARIAIRARVLRNPRDYLQLAEFCLSAGRPEAALQWAEDGLWLFEGDRPDERLVKLAARLLLDAGRTEKVASLLWKCFTRLPSLDLYRHIREVLGPDFRDRAIDWLRGKLAKVAPGNSWDFPADLLVRVLLDEGLVADAWDAARRHRLSEGLRLSLAAVGESTHPGEALAIYAAHIDKLVEQGGNNNYAEACRLLTRMAALQPPAAQVALVERLRSRFKAKRNFIKMLGVDA